MIEIMKKALLLLFFLFNQFIFAECIYCKKFHSKKYICLPQAHFYFLQKKNSPKLKSIYTERILNLFRKQRIKSLEKCKRLQKIFLAYYKTKKGSIKIIPRNVYAGRWLCFFNMYVTEQAEMILFNMALHIHAKNCVNRKLNRATFNEFN